MPVKFKPILKMKPGMFRKGTSTRTEAVVPMDVKFGARNARASHRHVVFRDVPRFSTRMKQPRHVRKTVVNEDEVDFDGLRASTLEKEGIKINFSDKGVKQLKDNAGSAQIAGEIAGLKADIAAGAAANVAGRDAILAQIALLIPQMPTVVQFQTLGAAVRGITNQADFAYERWGFPNRIVVWSDISEPTTLSAAFMYLIISVSHDFEVGALLTLPKRTHIQGSVDDYTVTNVSIPGISSSIGVRAPGSRSKQFFLDLKERVIIDIHGAKMLLQQGLPAGEHVSPEVIRILRADAVVQPQNRRLLIGDDGESKSNGEGGESGSSPGFWNLSDVDEDSTESGGYATNDPTDDSSDD